MFATEAAEPGLGSDGEDILFDGTFWKRAFPIIIANADDEFPARWTVEKRSRNLPEVSIVSLTGISSLGIVR